MLKNVSRLELLVAQKLYQFTCDMDAPISDAKEALFQFTKYVGQIEDQIKKKQTEEAEAKAKSDALASPVTEAPEVKQE